MTAPPRPFRRLLPALGLLIASGCTLSLEELPVPAKETTFTWVRSGGAAWGCHELASEIFQVYLVCPQRDVSLGVLEREGLLAFACPGRKPTTCANLARELLLQGGAPREVVEW